MENSLLKEMGETNKFSLKSTLPSEEELKCYLQNVENLEHTLVCGTCYVVHMMWYVCAYDVVQRTCGVCMMWCGVCVCAYGDCMQCTYM